MYCKECKVNVDGAYTICPLCKAPLEGTPADNPPFIKRKPRKKRSPVTAKGVYLVFALPVIIICIALNIVLPHRYIWAGFAVLAVIYGYLTLKTTVFYKGPGGAKVFSQTFMLSILCIAAQYIFRTAEWAFSFAVPSICILALLSHLVGYAAYRRQNKGRQYFRYMWLTSLIGFLPVIALYADVCDFVYLPLIAMCISGITVIILVIGSGRVIAEEIKKKSHI